MKKDKPDFVQWLEDMLDRVRGYGAKEMPSNLQECEKLLDKLRKELSDNQRKMGEDKIIK